MDSFATLLAEPGTLSRVWSECNAGPTAITLVKDAEPTAFQQDIFRLLEQACSQPVDDRFVPNSWPQLNLRLPSPQNFGLKDVLDMKGEITAS